MVTTGEIPVIVPAILITGKHTIPPLLSLQSRAASPNLETPLPPILQPYERTRQVSVIWSVDTDREQSIQGIRASRTLHWWNLMISCENGFSYWVQVNAGKGQGKIYNHSVAHPYHRLGASIYLVPHIQLHHWESLLVVRSTLLKRELGEIRWTKHGPISPTTWITLANQEDYERALYLQRMRSRPSQQLI